MHAEILGIRNLALSDDIAGAGGRDTVIDFCADVYADFVGRHEVVAVAFADDDEVAVLVDFDILEEVIVALDLDGGVVALGDEDFGCAAYFDVFKAGDAAVFGDDVTIAAHAFA